MKAIWQRIFTDAKRFWPITIISIILYVVVHKIKGAFCPAVIIFGLPCPGCGIVRAVLYVLKGQFAEAFYMNPCVYLWIVFLLYIIVVRYILGKKLKHMKVFMIVLVVAMLVRYGYGMCMYYPNRPPFSYTGGNMMEDRIPGYMHLVRDFEIWRF